MDFTAQDVVCIDAPQVEIFTRPSHANERIEWTDERIEWLKETKAAGYSADKSASEFWEKYGERITRNAIIGAWNRAGLSKPRGTKAEFVPIEWAPERIAEVKEFAAAGGSKAAAARYFNVSKSSIKWIASREKIQFRKSLPTPQQRKQSPDGLTEIRGDAWKPIEASRPIQFELVGNDQCRWPIGDINMPGLVCCGADAVGNGISYCGVHHQRAHRARGL